MVRNSYRYFKNIECEYYPCHEFGADEFNCLFCFCPLYNFDCPGNPRYIEYNGATIKDCSYCIMPHKADNYDFIIEVLKKISLNRGCG